MNTCAHASQSFVFVCGLVYDFQTLLTGILAICVAMYAGMPVWRQLKDSNLQTRISHRETLAVLLRDALQRTAQVDKAISKPLDVGMRLTIDHQGASIELDPNGAFHLEGLFRGVLDWYLVILADTEDAEVELRKKALKAALDELISTLHQAHWAEHNDQHSEDYTFSDEEWAEVRAKGVLAQKDASDRVLAVSRAYQALGEAQRKSARSLRTQIAKLDQQIAGPK